MAKIEILDLTGGNRFKAALDVQDACNLRAIARLLVVAADAAAEETKSTQGVYDDAAVVMIVNKLESLVRSDARFGAAYVLCHERAEATKTKLAAEKAAATSQVAVA